MTKPLVIGISAQIRHPTTSGHVLSGAPGKTLHYLEESVAHWILAKNVLAVMIPAIETEGLIRRSDLSVSAYAEVLDGLVLQGGADVAPQSYGETPLRPEWVGDSVRDRYEIDLFNAFVAIKKPVIGICRGCQLINVALGGSLYQDIPTQLMSAGRHREEALYDGAFHEIQILENSKLSKLCRATGVAKVNTIHHQAVKVLGRDLEVEAIGVPDGVIEAIRWSGPSYVFGIQWHPEFMGQRSLSDSQLDCSPIVSEFLSAARRPQEKIF